MWWNFPIAPKSASTYAEKYDLLFGAITALTIFFTVVVLALVIFFAVRYRVGSRANRERPSHENLKVEIAWSLPPLLLGVAIFGWSASDFVYYKSPPADAIEIFVIGKQWMWHIEHPNGVRENNTLHVPVGKPVKLTMISQDVIHAMYIPQFRVQYHTVPGRYTSLWFEATKTGKFYMFCAQHCGTQHSEMGGYVYALTQQEYAQWLENGGERPKPGEGTIAAQGKKLFDQLRCGTCHGPQDSENGPSLYNIAGSRRALDSGTALADDSYLRESIVEPYRRLTKGYINTMPADYKNQLTEENIRSLIEYIKTLGIPVQPSTGSATGAPNNNAASTPAALGDSSSGARNGNASVPEGRS